MLEKSRGLAVDNVTYDLEDAVTHSQKSAARVQLAQFLTQPRAPSIREQAVRINAVNTKLALEDMTAVVRALALKNIQHRGA